MKIIMFYHSLASDWNHGNAHFLRGVTTELIERGHQVKVFEPEDSWSRENLLMDYGSKSEREFEQAYPSLKINFYDSKNPNYYKMLKGADLVIVHEWNDPELVKEIGLLKSIYKYLLLFHDTHHRAVSEEESMQKYDFSNYDGALVFGNVLKEIYQKKNWLQNVWVWHEAADSSLFKTLEKEKIGDLVWIGNWGDDERTKELMEFLIEPVKELKLKAKVYGVRYPEHALKALKDAGIEYGGYLPNYKVPEVFAQYNVTVHVPRGPYVQLLPGIPTIRPFEAMACGIPLISAPWHDAENLFDQQNDFLMAKDGAEMKELLQKVLIDKEYALSMAGKAQKTISTKHTCKNRVDELEAIITELQSFKLHTDYQAKKEAL